MTLENQFTNQQKGQPVFFKSMLIGAGIALLAISFFVFGVDEPNPEWGTYWMIRPLIITPLAGAVGGAFYAFIDYQSTRGFNKTLATIFGFTIYIIGLWLGVVLGLDGTLWD